MTSRRQFLKAGIAASVMLAGAGWLSLRREHGPAPGLRWLDERGAAIITALVPAILEGMLPAGQPARATATRQVVEAFDRAASGLSPAAQSEIAQLLSLLGLAAGRFVVAGVRSEWAEATVGEVSAFLARWRSSRFALLRSGYQALVQLTIAAWYGNSSSWGAIGYPGPPPLESGPA